MYGDRPAITCEGRTLSSAEVFERSVRLANVLLAGGLRQGDRVAVLAPNCVFSMEFEFGCALAGLVRVSLNARLSDDELLNIVGGMGVSGLIYAGRYGSVAERFEESGSARSLLRIELDPTDEGVAAGIEYDEALAKASTDRPRQGLDGDSLYCLFSSSGTTGKPKGVMLSHRAQLAVSTNLLMEYGPVNPGGSILLPQPLSHGGGFFMLPYYLSGGHCVVVDRFDTAAYDLAVEHGVETFKVVPTMLIDLLKSGATPTSDYAPRKIIYGAAPMPHQWLQRGLEVFGSVFLQLYGQAEAPMCVTVLPQKEHQDDRLLGSAGRPYRSIEVKIVDSDAREVEPGEHGEVVVRGAHLMDGYWEDPEKTAEVLRDGYLHTRDNATVDERGYVFLLGRSDEMINSGGFNVAPRVVEHALHGHPDIAEAAVVGAPDERLGEVVKAYVVVRPGAELDADAVIEFCRPRLGMQRPREVEFMSDLPKSAYGKVVKAQLGQAPEDESDGA